MNTLQTPNSTVDRRSKFVAVKSMSMDSQGSSGSFGSNVHLGHGGSYSSKTGKLITPNDGGTSKLAEVAKALMAAKLAGDLPQASKKDLELQETIKKQKEEAALALAQAQQDQFPVRRQQHQNGQAAQPTK